MASSGEDWGPAGGAARCKRSRTMSDFEHPRPRDSNSIPATRGSGNRTVRVLMGIVYYGAAMHARRSRDSFIRVPTWGSSHLFLQMEGAFVCMLACRPCSRPNNILERAQNVELHQLFGGFRVPLFDQFDQPAVLFHGAKRAPDDADRRRCEHFALVPELAHHGEEVRVPRPATRSAAT